VKDGPRIASWFLSRFGCSSNNEAVLGDLLEHFQDNQSRTWFWRQVLIALVTGFRTELSLHRLDAARAVLAGWFMLSLSSFLMWNLYTGILQTRGVSEWLYRTNAIAFPALLAVTALLGCAATYACGRLLARWLGPRFRAPLLLFAGSLVAAVVVSVVAGVRADETIISVNGIFTTQVTVWISPRFWTYALGNPLALLGLLAGAGFFRRPERRKVITKEAAM
jgi:hypothetical protein